MPRPLPPAGRILAATRAGVWILFVLAAVNGLFLYFLSDRADTDYAWSIKPPASAAFIACGFLAGTLVTGLVLFATRRWRSLQTLPPALWVLATELALATVIHHDRFKFDYPPTWIWVLIYAGIPFATPVLVYRQRRTAEPRPAADPRLRSLRVISAVVGAVLLIGSLALYIAPADLGKHWPWMLTPLLARVVAAWYGLFGTMLVACAVGLRHSSEAFLPYITMACWSVLLLTLPWLHSDDIAHSGSAFWIWIAGTVLLLALSAFGLARSVPGVRRARL